MSGMPQREKVVELKKLLKYDGSNSIKHKAAITAALITLLALVSFGGAVRAEAGDAFRDLEGKCVAVQTGTISGEVALSVIPDLEVNYFNTQTDCLAALRAGKVDAWASDEPMIRFLMIDNPDLIMYGDKLDESSLAAVFAKSSKGQALCDEYSAFVDELWENGTMAEIDAAWFGADEDKRTVPDYENLPATNGTLSMAVDTSLLPFAYVKDNRIVGYDVDIAARFCEKNGYRLQVEQMDFAGILPAVQSGKCDFAACGITVTEERAESVLFSNPNYHSGTVLAVLKDEIETAAAGAYTSLSQLDGKRIGVQSGSDCQVINADSSLPVKVQIRFRSYNLC